MKTYYVTYSGSATIEAENEDDACEIALSKISIDEVNAYEIDENGNIVKNNVIL